MNRTISGDLNPESGQWPSLATYMRDIGRVPLLDQEEEADLTRRVSAGDERALKKLVTANLRFVVSVAKRYKNQGVPLEDLINEGAIGLIKAAHRYRADRGTRFLTYAVWWIRQAILKCLAACSRPVRLPGYRAIEISKMIQASRRLEQKLGRAARADEIAGNLGISVEKVREIARINTPHLSLDRPVVEDERMTIGERISDESGRGADDEVDAQSMATGLRRALRSLPERERHVVIGYFGLLGHERMTLERLGRALGLTRERIRQIKNHAIARLRRSGDLEPLREAKG